MGPRANGSRYSAAAAVLLFASPMPALAWGLTGHSLVARQAAFLVLKGESAGLSHPLTGRAPLLSYYAVVPDVLWKKDDRISAQERPQHWVALETFDRLILTGDRSTFFSRHPNIDLNAGRVLWRIGELGECLKTLQTTLQKPGPTARKGLASRWLLHAGILSHYTADIAVPLHVTVNHNGQLSAQHGLHKYWESTLVDVLMPDLENAVRQQAVQRWPQFLRQADADDAFAVAEAAARRAATALPQLLATDRRMGRADVGRAAQAHGRLIRERLVDAVLVTALLWTRATGWTTGGKHIEWLSTPAYIPPGPSCGAPSSAGPAGP